MTTSPQREPGASQDGGRTEDEDDIGSGLCVCVSGRVVHLLRRDLRRTGAADAMDECRVRAVCVVLVWGCLCNRAS